MNDADSTERDAPVTIDELVEIHHGGLVGDDQAVFAIRDRAKKSGYEIVSIGDRRAWCDEGSQRVIDVARVIKRPIDHLIFRRAGPSWRRITAVPFFLKRVNPARPCCKKP